MYPFYVFCSLPTAYTRTHAHSYTQTQIFLSCSHSLVNLRLLVSLYNLAQRHRITLHEDH